MDDGNTVDVVHFDFANVFDSVNHRLLLAKLLSFGLFDNTVRWVRSYLMLRTYRVEVADAFSQRKKVNSGVPQGPLLRSLLFLLVINNVAGVINATTLLFAGDVKMVSPHSQSELLQGSLYNVWN